MIILRSLGLISLAVSSEAGAMQVDVGSAVSVNVDAQARTVQQVMADACTKKVVLLGEGPTHGDGMTDLFKVALVKRLIEDCGFSAIFFESSFYEFVALEKQIASGGGAPVEKVGAAIGGLWKFDKEFLPLIPFLSKQAAERGVFLGGIDDQVGGFEQDYSNNVLPKYLTDGLPTPVKELCAELLKHRIYQNFPKEKPYSLSDQKVLLDCLNKSAEGHSSAKYNVAGDRARDAGMISSLKRLVYRDFIPANVRYRLRDEAMYSNFLNLSSRLKRGSKIIIWGSTMHMAKDARSTAEFGGARNFGSFIHARYGRQAFSLGFSALTGSVRLNRRESKPLPKAPSDSMEAIALAASNLEMTYLDNSALLAMGKVPGAAFRHEYQIANWGKALDGVVIFREERPAQSTRK